jgi:hypothetical protein
VFFVALLALVQVAAFWFVNAANSGNAHAKVEEELNLRSLSRPPKRPRPSKYLQLR